MDTLEGGELEDEYVLHARQSNSKRHRSIEEIISHMRELMDISVGVGLRMAKERYRLADASETNAS